MGERLCFSTSNSQLATSNFPNAFTLIELMISIAMMLLLIVGINYVFQMTTDAIGAGNAANTFARDSQSVQTILFDDFRNINKDPPCFIIASQLVTQFLNSADAQTGSDPTKIVIDPTTIETVGNAPVGPATLSISPAILNYRSHRADIVKFFAHGFYQRRSANDGSYTSSTTATDAFITLGHALLPTNDGSQYVGPVTDGAGNTAHLSEYITTPAVSNTNVDHWNLLYNASGPTPQQRLGAYAADWVLARSVVLLKDASTNVSTTGNLYAENCYPRFPNSVNGAFPQAAVPFLANLTPLGEFSPDSKYNNTNPNAASNLGPTQIQSSRYDFAAVTPDQFRRAIADEILQWRNAGYIGGHLWWNPLIYSLAANQGNNAGPLTPTGSSTPSYYASPIAPYAALPPAYQFGSYATGTFVATINDTNTPPNPVTVAPDLAHMACNPQIQSPLNSASIAQMAPYFLQHCSQFIVEYAGDYLQQDGYGTAAPLTPPTGQITGLGPDGQIDYVIVTDAAGNRYKRIRWYGMPRSSNGGTLNTYAWDPNRQPPAGYKIRGYNPALDKSTDNWTGHGIMEEFVDVIPLRDYYSMYLNTLKGTTGYYVPPWEVDVNFDCTADYAQPQAFPGGFNNVFHTSISDDTTHTPPSPQNNARYAAAWYNDMPAMIRILIKVDDPNDKLKDGPWYEYVFKLK